MAESQLDVLNRAPVEQAAEWPAACNGSRHWIEQVLAGRPYRDADTLLSAADRAARSPDRQDVRQALDAQPGIGDHVVKGPAAEAQRSRDEQAAVADAGRWTSFRVTGPERHHHAPLLLSPYAYSTYRGS